MRKSISPDNKLPHVNSHAYMNSKELDILRRKENKKKKKTKKLSYAQIMCEEAMQCK